MKKLLKRTLSHWPELLLLLAIVFFFKDLIFFGKIITTPAFGLGDYTIGVIPSFDYISQSLKDGRLPLWSPNYYSGYPFASDTSMFFLPNFILSYLFPTATVLNTLAVATFIMTALFTYYFVKSLNLSKEAALISSLSITFAAGKIVKIGHMPNATTLAFLPLQFLIINKFIKTRNPLYIIASGIILSQQFLNYNPPTTLLAWLSFFLYFIYKLSLSKSKNRLTSTALPIFFSFLIATLLSSILLLPTFQIASQSVRKSGVSEEFQNAFHFYPTELLYFLRPDPFGDPSLGNYNSPHPTIPSIHFENNAYIGLIGLFLGLLAIITLTFRNKEATFFSLLFIFSVLMALGTYSPTQFIHRLPPLSFFRIPGRYMLLAMPSLAILAGFGFDKLTLKFKQKRTLLAFILSALILIDLFSFGLTYNTTFDTESWITPPQTAKFLEEDKSFFRYYTVGDHLTYQDIRLTHKNWRQNFAPYSVLREFLLPEFNLLFNINHAEGLVGLPPQRLSIWQEQVLKHTTLDSINNTYTFSQTAIKMLRTKSVKYIITPFPIQGDQFTKVFQTENDQDLPIIYIYELKDPFPHAFIVHQTKLSKNQDTALESFLDEDFDPQTTVLLEEDFAPIPEIYEKVIDQVNITNYQPEKVEIKTQTNQPGFLVLSDTYFPGWQTTVNGKPAKIYQANYLFRAIRLEPGKHQIIFQYKPKSFYIGTTITGITLISISIFSAVYLLRKKRK